MRAEERANQLEGFAQQFVAETRELLMRAADDTRELQRMREKETSQILADDEDADQLRTLVREFGDEMIKKLFSKLEDGWSGWTDRGERENFHARILHHVARGMEGEEGQWVDVANFAAFLDHMEAKR